MQQQYVITIHYNNGLGPPAILHPPMIEFPPLKLATDMDLLSMFQAYAKK